MFCSITLLLLAPSWRGVLHGLHDVLISGAAAQVAGDAPANVVFAGLGILLKQRIRRHQHAGRAEAALQAVLFFEAFLQRMELPSLIRPSTVRMSQPSACGVNMVHDLTVLPSSNYGARAAVAGVATDVRAGQSQHLANKVDEQQPGLDLSLAIAAIHFDVDYLLLRHTSPVLRDLFASALDRARQGTKRQFLHQSLFCIPPGRAGPNSVALPRPPSCAACRRLASSSFLPRRNASAFVAFNRRGPNIGQADARLTGKLRRRQTVTCAATAAVAKSPTFRSSLKYAPPLRGGRHGNSNLGHDLVGLQSAVVKSETKNSSIGMTRSPFGPVATIFAPSASMVAG